MNFYRNQSTLYRKIINHDTLDKDDYACIRPTGYSHNVFGFHTLIPTTSSEKAFTLVSGCSCAYEFEYFEHIDNACGSKTDILDRICGSLENNRCPHVVDVHDGVETIATTVSALHVAIAVDYKDVYMTLLLAGYNTHQPSSNVFYLGYLQLAVVKHRYSFLTHAMNGIESRNISLTNIVYFTPTQVFSEPCTNSYQYSGKLLTLLKLSVKRNDVEMIRILSRSFINRPHSSLVFSIISRSHFTTRILLEQLKEGGYYPAGNDELSDRRHKWGVQFVIEMAILCDDCDTLDMFTRNDWICRGEDYNQEVSYIQLASIMQHENCIKIIKSWESEDISEDNQVFTGNVFNIIITKTLNRYPKLCCLLLHELARLGHDINKVNAGEEAPLMRAIERRMVKKYKTVIALLELGADLNIQTATGDTALSKLLARQPFLKTAELVKRFLHRNPRIESEPIQSERYIRRAIIADCTTPRYIDVPWWDKFDRIPATAVSDSTCWLPESCLTYLLWECGYPVPTDVITDSNIHTRIQTFINDVTCRPRDLRRLCRDKLRAHFWGLNIHQFVEKSECPTFIKKFILMDDLLKVD